MDPITKAILLSWNWRLDVIFVLAFAGTLYSWGWWRLRRRTFNARRGFHSKRLHTTRNKWRLAVRWRLVAYWFGLLFVALSLLSPIDVLGQQLFLMHMIQHLLLIMFAPPLLLVANPMPFILWGLPDKTRFVVGRFLNFLLRKDAPFRNLLLSVTHPGFLWLFWVIALAGWHDPNLYNAALHYERVHDVEHLSFFLVSMLFWWNITGAGPRIHKQFGLIARIVLVLAAVPPNMGLGVILAFVGQPVYSYYLSVPRLWGIDILTDQQIGGLIMWIPGSMMYLIAALILISRLLSGHGQSARTEKKETPPAVTAGIEQ
ncbi:MAG: cytochrome c oxidase assembly protein [Chloroflexi bacterium]|nr:cytochrome c oxidase assembly protein [Chloroflexota bacterium]